MKVAIIGAGSSGLMAGLTAHHLGWAPEIFEAHSKPGGCASFFRRKSEQGEWVFDAGATVLNALGEGQKLWKTLKALGITFDDYEPIDSVGFALPTKKLFWLETHSIESQLKSLLTHFPNDAECLANLFHRLGQVAVRSSKGFEKVPHLPIETWGDLRMNRPALPWIARDLLTALRGDSESLGELLTRHRASTELRQWVNMNLLITLQCRDHEVNPYWGALSLFFYPLGAGALASGMKGYFTKLLSTAQSRFPVRMKTLVTELKSQDQRWWLNTPTQAFGPYDAVLSSAPRFNTLQLLRQPMDVGDEHLWTANVAYWGVPDEGWMPARAFNVHSKISTEEVAGAEVYASFSSRQGSVSSREGSASSREGFGPRAPVGFRAVTLSTHERLDRWVGPRDEAYKAEKKRVLAEQFQAHLGSLGLQKPVFEEYATGQSFLRYTHRYKGSVGGLPMNQRGTLWGSPSQRTRHWNLLQIGDTAFPGQSVYATSIGALAALEKLSNRKISL